MKLLLRIEAWPIGEDPKTSESRLRKLEERIKREIESVCEIDEPPTVGALSILTSPDVSDKVFGAARKTMGAAGAIVESADPTVPEGFEPIEAFYNPTTGICFIHGPLESNDESHNCDEMGCGSVTPHVTYCGPVPVGNKIGPETVLTGGDFDLGGNYAVVVDTLILGGARASLWHGTPGDDGDNRLETGSGDSPALAIWRLLSVLAAKRYLLPAPVTEKLADLASRASREIALLLAAPAPTSEEAPHA